jgi:hypothetical protein
VVKLIKVLTRRGEREKTRPVEERIVRPSEIPGGQRPYKRGDHIDFPFETGMSAIWKDDYYEFDVKSRRAIRSYLLDQWGPGYYRMYKWGGQPPSKEYYQGWTL